MRKVDEQDLEEAVLKNRVLSNNFTFWTAFKATMGFYAAQFLATVLGLLSFAVLVAISVFVYKLLA